MNRLLIASLLVASLAGCSRTDGEMKRAVDLRAQPEKMMPAPSTTDGTQRRTLAYVHSIQLDAPEDRIPAVQEAAVAACHQAAADLCEVLESRISSGQFASASLRFRAKPEGIRKIIATMKGQAEVTSQSTEAEDLAGPILDGEKKIAMLTTYRADLETLRKRSGNDVDALIKVTHELAQVQSDLESANGTQAALVRRVETEILHISIESRQSPSFWRPISQATSGFGASLAQGISSTITGVAYLLPWLLVIGLVVWVGRKVWRRRKPSQG